LNANAGNDSLHATRPDFTVGEVLVTECGERDRGFNAPCFVVGVSRDEPFWIPTCVAACGLAGPATMVDGQLDIAGVVSVHVEH